MSDRTNTFYPSQAFHGYGAQIEVGNGASPEIFEAVAFVDEITPGDMSTAVLESTHLRSPDAHREKIAGLRDSGPFSLKGRWVPGEQSQSNAGGGSGPFASGGLIALWRGRQQHNMRIVLNDGSPNTIWPFRGIVTKFQPQTIGDAVVDFMAEITPVHAFDTLLP